MGVPQSVIHVCSYVPFNSKYEHTIAFNDVAEQENYFISRIRKTFSGYTYLRKTWSIKVDSDLASADSWNYLFFWNSAQERTYYYFINRVEYVSENTVELFLEMDVIQTYLFDFTLQPSYIERMHHDGIDNGCLYTDEQLELGDFTINDVRHTSIMDELCVCFLATINPNAQTVDDNSSRIIGQVLGNTFVGMGVWAVQQSDITAFAHQLDHLSSIGLVDGIITMWMYPKNFIQLMDGQSWDGGSTCKNVVANVSNTLPIVWNRNRIDSYEPRNTKLMHYPYNFIYVTNGNGCAATYKIELFPEENISFRLQGSVSPEGGIRLIPECYNQSDDSFTFDNTDEALIIQGYPSCAWNADGYKIWLAQNQNQHAMQIGMGQLQIAAGAAGMLGSAVMLNAEGAVQGMQTAINGALQIAQHVAAKKDAAIQPPQARGTFSNNINIADNDMHFTLMRKSITRHYAEIIDKYFDMYGYKWNKYYQPKICVREAYTYIKTIGCQITGNFGNEDRVKICNIFDRGITFWKPSASLFDYTQSNNILPPELQY